MFWWSIADSQLPIADLFESSYRRVTSEGNEQREKTSP